MNDMRAIEKILGIETKMGRAQNNFFLCQKEYIKKMLDHFRMAVAKAVCTPLTITIYFSKVNATQSKSEKKYMSCVSYCHTLISSGDFCLMTCDLSLVLVRCLVPIIRQFVKFQDMPENHKKY